MYAFVKLLNGFQQELVYHIPLSIDPATLRHRIIQVPLQKRTELALVMRVVTQPIQASFEIKQIDKIVSFPYDEQYQPFIAAVARYHQIDQISLLRRLQQFIKTESAEIITESLSTSTGAAQLSKEQLQVVHEVAADIDVQRYQATLLHGVTGSGKTEVYCALMRHAIAASKSVIFCAPEISLAAALQQRIAARLPDIPVLSFHSGTATAERKKLWNLLLQGTPCIIVGVHVPVLLPLSNLGLIIVDEEHEVGYQEKKHPKLNSKEVALLRAHRYKIPILLGSATPSLHSLYSVQHRGWRFCQLLKRFSGSLPTVRVVLLDKQRRQHFFVSDQLKSAIDLRLQRKEQTILFLNRRGYSFFVQCESCDKVTECVNCSVSLTLHEDGILRCHYCAYTQAFVGNCATCQSEMVKRGIGTQQLVQIIKKMFPHARVERADLDVSTTKKWRKVLGDFQSGEIDILVGTQTIAKGHHFPNVTLVGVIWADVNAHVPMYNAQEVALAQLLQVIGRAGRAEKPGEAILQTIQNLQIYNYLSEEDYPKFYTDECATREMLSYPPCGRLVELELIHEREDVVDRDARVLATRLRAVENIQVLGPALPPVAKLKNAFRRRLYIKATDMASIISVCERVDRSGIRSHLYFTPNPLS